MGAFRSACDAGPAQFGGWIQVNHWRLVAGRAQAFECGYERRTATGRLSSDLSAPPVRTQVAARCRDGFCSTAAWLCSSAMGSLAAGKSASTGGWSAGSSAHPQVRLPIPGRKAALCRTRSACPATRVVAPERAHGEFSNVAAGALSIWLPLPAGSGALPEVVPGLRRPRRAAANARTSHLMQPASRSCHNEAGKHGLASPRSSTRGNPQGRARCENGASHQMKYPRVHEASHGSAYHRGISDSSRQERHHNHRFKTVAEEFGLDLCRDPVFGWSRSSLTAETASFCCETLACLTVALRESRAPGQPVDVGSAGPARNRHARVSVRTSDPQPRQRICCPSGHLQRLREAPKPHPAGARTPPTTSRTDQRTTRRGLSGARAAKGSVDGALQWSANVWSRLFAPSR